MKFIQSRTTAVVAGATVLALAGGGTVAVAAGTIGSGGIQNGSIRSVDVKDGGLGVRDFNDYTQALINQPGPAGKDGVDGKDGAAGPAGAAGKDGAPGQAGKDGVSGYEVQTYDYALVSGGGIATVACSDGKTALGGGYWLKNEGVLTNGTTVVRSMPGRMDWSTNTPKPDNYTGWIVQVNKPQNVNPGEMTVYVTCATVTN